MLKTLPIQLTFGALFVLSALPLCAENQTVPVEELMQAVENPEKTAKKIEEATAETGAESANKAVENNKNADSENSENGENNENSEEEKEQAVNLKIEGIEDKDLLENVQIHVNKLAKEEADVSERYKYLVQQEIDKGLRAKGWYRSQYLFDLQENKKGDKPTLVVRVQLDKDSVKVNETDIKITGEAEKDRDVINLVKTAPEKGTVLNHGTYDDFKSAVDSLLYRKGYFDGEWQYHRLEVYPSEYIADWRLGYSSGERYRYGAITMSGNQIREDYLRNILKIKEGDHYLASDLATLTADYSSSKWFASVLVEPEIKDESKTVDLNVQFSPKKKNGVEVGIGVASDVGPRLQVKWDKPWLNNRGHSLQTNTYISKPEQSFEFGYNIPVKENPLDYYYQFSGGIEHEEQNDTKTTGAHLGFQRFWNHKRGWSYSLGFKARYDSFRQASDKFSTLLLYPTASASYLRTDGNRFPMWGEKLNFTVDWGSEAWGSEVNFHRAKATAAIVRNLHNTHRFYLRADWGYLRASEFPRIPPSLRYFAGGDASIRGFGYKKVSPKDENGKLTGGSHLVTATAEYQYRFYPSWWGAVFYDTGLAARNYKTTNLHSGVGIGVRWVSPIGAIKFDLATPVRSPNNLRGVKYYIGLGSEL